MALTYGVRVEPEGMQTSRVTDVFDRGVMLLQPVMAALLLALLVLGIVALGSFLLEAVLSRDVFESGAVLGISNSTIDIVLYLFFIVELYQMMIANVDSKSVVLAVVHAGLVAVVRQSITFKPADYGPEQALAFAGVSVVLPVPLLAGFLIVHREADDPGESLQ